MGEDRAEEMGEEMSGSSDTAVLTFVARRSAVEPCLRWHLGADTLVCTRDPAPASRLSWLAAMPSDHWPGRLPLGEITAIRLRFDPTRYAPDRYRCDLSARNGARTSIFSTHYAGIGDFENRADDYTAFISALTRRVQRLNPSVRLAGGLSWPGYLLQHGLLLAALIALVSVLGIAGIPLLGLAWVKLAIIATYAGAALRYAWINIPKDFSLPVRKE